MINLRRQGYVHPDKAESAMRCWEKLDNAIARSSVRKGLEHSAIFDKCVSISHTRRASASSTFRVLENDRKDVSPCGEPRYVLRHIIAPSLGCCCCDSGCSKDRDLQCSSGPCLSDGCKNGPAVRCRTLTQRHRHLKKQQQPQNKKSYSRPESLVEDLENSKEGVHGRLPTKVIEGETGRGLRMCSAGDGGGGGDHTSTQCGWFAKNVASHVAVTTVVDARRRVVQTTSPLVA